MRLAPLFVAGFAVLCLGWALFLPRETLAQGSSIAIGLVSLTIAVILRLAR